MIEAVELAVDRLRRGRPVAIGPLVCLSLELAGDGSLSDFDRDKPADLVVAARRATFLRLGNARAAAGMQATRIVREGWHTLPELLALADPLMDMAAPLKSPLRARDMAPAVAHAAAAALELCRLAGLLPAVMVRESEQADALNADAILAYDATAAAALTRVATARVPLFDAEDCRIHAFRAGAGAADHLAIEVGVPPRSTPVLARIHSECFTGDLLASLKCDCGPQLRGAIQVMRVNAQGGVVLYLGQEGRGIGLINKLRAYALQDQGFDTVDANLRLGFPEDARDFAPAARMLGLLGFSSVRLLTNNPDKVAGLTTAGMPVVERVPHQLGENPHNSRYLQTKRDKSGHWLPE